MTPERWEQIENLFHAVLDLTQSQRHAFLHQACAGDDELRREVESLLASHEHARAFIESPPDDVAAGMLADAQANSILGRTLGHYRIDSLLGAGGMGEVYRARDIRLDRDVAVKILPEQFAHDSEALRRFEREAKAVAALSHPNILSIFDYGAEQGLNYAVMELLEGETLGARLQRGAVGWRDAVEVGSAVAEGLAAAHAKGVIHRDLKPENIFLTAGGQVKILDFGVARIKQIVMPDSETLTTAETTRPGAILGTIGYMSPEQVRGDRADAPSDIFSLGCVLYEMVSGRRPFANAAPAETIAAILKEDPPALTRFGREVPAELERLIQGCLEKQASSRPQSAGDLARTLKAIAEGPGTPPILPTGALPGRRLIAGVGVAAAVLLLGALVWVVLVSGGDEIIDSLAVLPLANASGDENVEYMSEGITESLISSLSQLPQMKRVIARSTVASYKNKDVDPRAVGRDLKVRSVLTGTLSKRGDELRIVAELVNVTDGSRLWGDSIQRKLDEAMSIQAELARQIAEKLRLKLTGEDRRRLAKRPTDSSEAYRLYVAGRHYSQLRTTDGVKKGVELLQRAVQLDPDYALAYAGLADCYYNASGTYAPPAEVMPKIKATAEQALGLDETLAEAHTALAQVKAFYEWDWAEAEKELKRALELNPGYARAAYVYGMILSEQGRVDEAIGQFTRAHELDPLSSETSAWIAFAYYLNRKYDESIQESKKLLDADRTFITVHINLAMAYEQQGRFAEAEAELNQWQSLDPGAPYPKVFSAHLYAISGRREAAQKILNGFSDARSAQNYIDPFYHSLVYAGMGDKEQAFVWLEKAFQAKSEDMLNLKKDPRLDGLRADPRFNDLLRRLKLAP
jgi:serine/threonine protein kinase/tetratricopeptide (TPR) repeat protein